MTCRSHNKVASDTSTDLNLLDYAIWDVLENKTNATPHPNIGNERKKISNEFILKVCKSFRRRVDTMIEKMTAILNKFCFVSHWPSG